MYIKDFAHNSLIIFKDFNDIFVYIWKLKSCENEHNTFKILQFLQKG